MSFLWHNMWDIKGECFMSGLVKIFGTSIVSFGMCVAMCVAASAATGRDAYSNVRTTSIGTATGRMPSMPVTSIGNVVTTIPDAPSTPGQPDVPDEPDTPDVPDEPDVPDNPVPPTPECPDGGVKNSQYTIDNCMDDILRCINNGALPNGLNDMFNEDVRNSIVNGMGLCRAQVDKCVSDVRVDCENVYGGPSDVWIDFNLRRVQPEYYNFVLRKTGLTPNQAENTCRLLDKNTFGSSFAAVDNRGRVTAEYNQNVGAYNQQRGNVLVKDAPQGVRVNDGNPGVDGARGHYARWDATTATCYLRVAAYNKDKHISNSWLFGAVGDDTPAEVWRAAGDTFTCNKDLFGFSLMKDTSTVAAVGIGGGTVLGAGIGAAAGHGKRDFDCMRENHREMLKEYLSNGRTVAIINEYINNDIDVTGGSMTIDSCVEIVGLYDKYYAYETAISECMGVEYYGSSQLVVEIPIERSATDATVEQNSILKMAPICAAAGYVNKESCTAFLTQQCVEQGSVDACKSWLSKNGVMYTSVSETEMVADENQECMFKALNLDKRDGTGIYCWTQAKCVPEYNIQSELNRLTTVFNTDVRELMQNGEKSNMGKSIGIGAAIGAGTGGLATAITAFVERNNINCRVGDGLDQVGFGKAHSIGTLKDFYVKWNLNLPETAEPVPTK